MNCDQCCTSRINGVFCHEFGCPNWRKVWDEELGEWVSAELDRLEDEEEGKLNGRSLRVSHGPMYRAVSGIYTGEGDETREGGTGERSLGMDVECQVDEVELMEDQNGR